MNLIKTILECKKSKEQKGKKEKKRKEKATKGQSHSRPNFKGKIDKKINYYYYYYYLLLELRLTI
jgi:hypothetical protein